MEPAVEGLRGVEHAELSDMGLRRANNQDAFVVYLASSDESWRRRGHLFIVADGMGAHAAGELASKLAVDTIPLTYHKLRDKPAHLALKKAIQEANHLIHHKGLANPDFQGMGTTTTALLLLPSGAIVAHVGDSRAYRLRGTELAQLSFDHSLVWELTAAGQLPLDAPTAIPRNIITRSLGPNADVEVDLEGPFPVTAGDVFLVCSDGLSGQVSDEEIGVVLQCLPPPEAAQLLVDLANLRGGPDNITLIIARAMSNFVEKSEEIAVGPSRRMSPLSWLILAATLIFAGTLAIVARPMVALIAGAVGLVLTLLTLAQGKRAVQDTPRGRLGRGPHKTWTCKPDAAFVQEMARVFDQLRSAAVEEDWRMDWAHIDTLTRQAQQAAQSKQFAAAIANYGRAISFMMRELKNQSAA